MAIKFDNTINLSHVISVGLIALAGVAGFYSQGSRIGILEDRDTQRQAIAAERMNQSNRTLEIIQGDVKDLQRSVNAISLAVASGRASVTVNSDGRK